MLSRVSCSLIALVACLLAAGVASAVPVQGEMESLSILQQLLSSPRERAELRAGETRLPSSAFVNKLQEELNEIAAQKGDLSPEVSADGPLKLKRGGDRACWRNVLPRHARVPTKANPCDSKHEVMEDGICYERCMDNQQGLGPLCLSRCRCKLTYTSLFFCCDSKDVCTELTSGLFTRLPLALVQFIVDISANPSDVQKIVEDFRNLVDTVMGFLLPLCDDEFTQNCAKPSPKEILTATSSDEKVTFPVVDAL